MQKTTPAPEASGGFGQFVYNKERGEVFGRTGISWAKIGIFYVIYYAGLAAFFIALLSIFLYAFTDDKAPVLTGKYSVLPPLPGMGYQPMIKAEQTLLTYDMRKDEKNSKVRTKYIDAMGKFLKTGVRPDRVASALKNVNFLNPDLSKVQNCDTGAPTEVTQKTKPCMFNASAIPGFVQSCPPNDYGYSDGKPCVAVKMNRIYEFMPEIVNGSDEILIKCEGEHIADRDNVGKISYFPAKGDFGVIKKHFFPFVGQSDYMTPLVFIKFEGVVQNILVQVVCRPTNLVNVKTDGKEEQGKIHFEVFITNE